jgi:hypothetical protein
MSKITMIWPASFLRRELLEEQATEAERLAPSTLSFRRDAVYPADPKPMSHRVDKGVRFARHCHLSTGPFVTYQRVSCGNRSCRLPLCFRLAGRNLRAATPTRGCTRECVGLTRSTRLAFCVRGGGS